MDHLFDIGAILIGDSLYNGEASGLDINDESIRTIRQEFCRLGAVGHTILTKFRAAWMGSIWQMAPAAARLAM